ncbi:MAG: iron-containing alcohol dehydrogenase [Bacillota bacterium]|nr:iron-containing alcohol dehydrogenase [Bacillota bacterium]
MISKAQDKGRQLLKAFKGDNYAYGFNVLEKTGDYAARFGKKALVIGNHSSWLQPAIEEVINSLNMRGVRVAAGSVIPGARPNTPTEDVYRIATCILKEQPECLIAIGAGSTIDAVKAANILATIGQQGPDIEDYFGVGLVSQALKETGKKLLPVVAVETAASSGAHLTKYSNVTDLNVGQKKLIVDEAIVPQAAVFDYGLTKSMPKDVTLDGAFDGIAHCMEVFYGASEEKYSEVAEIALTGIELIVAGLKKLMEDITSDEGRELIGMGTDLGGMAIMVGGTNGAHLTSFSLVDITSHGRACAIMNPYYTVFFAPAIQPQLKAVGAILQRNGFVDEDLAKLEGVELAKAVAKGMIKLSESVSFPTKLSQLTAFSDSHIEKALAAAKNPQLEMKLKNMPVALNSELVNEYMGPILLAAKNGDLELIKQL